MERLKLNVQEQQALKRLHTLGSLAVNTEGFDRLLELGLAEEKLGGLGISEKGKKHLIRVVKA